MGYISYPLSCITANTISVPPSINLTEIVYAQKGDAKLHHLTKSNSSLFFKEVPVPTTAVIMICYISTGTPRPYIPPKFHQTIFD